MKPVFTLLMPIRWGDMDAMGHVNNTVYFRYLEQARISWFESLGHGGKDADGCGPVIINANMTFIRQLRYPGDIEIRMYAGEPGRTSFETRMEIRRTDQPDVVYAEGGAKVVWCDYEAEKSVPVPPAIRALIE
ncbi:thioesterase family protein [Cupriavidus basilensis]|uniref:Thioesterase family protein n=1 Tax=Cupriavidus basilensis TaxID=68895 RepID=A0ABT6B5Y4_9BURK|nr:thioesterase family protein [Cupriavidus basilensis]MDF3839426.1 thioesterase family protein [Cupriavidus basilensis]